MHKRTGHKRELSSMIQNGSFPAFMFYIICGQFLSDTKDKIKSKGHADVINTFAMSFFYTVNLNSFLLYFAGFYYNLITLPFLPCRLPRETPLVWYGTSL